VSHVGKAFFAHFGMPKLPMARIHPSSPQHGPATLGAYRERDILSLLEQSFDNRFDVFHNLPWSGMQGERTRGHKDLLSMQQLRQRKCPSNKAQSKDLHFRTKNELHDTEPNTHFSLQYMPRPISAPPLLHSSGPAPCQTIG
jgi:hypothetical protein